MSGVKTILFDLDGTITDSASGVIQAYQYAFEAMGANVPPPLIIKRFIGRPLRTNLSLYIPHNQIEEAVDHYFYSYDYMRGGLTDNYLYEGVAETLHDLCQKGIKLYIVSGKLIELILPILNLFHIEECFDGIYGAHRDGTNSSKEELITSALSGAGLDPATTLMVGDRSFDVIGARKNGVRCAVVTWGYADEQELVSCKPDWLISEPSELVQIVQAGRSSLAS